MAAAAAFSSRKGLEAPTSSSSSSPPLPPAPLRLPHIAGVSEETIKVYSRTGSSSGAAGLSSTSSSTSRGLKSSAGSSKEPNSSFTSRGSGTLDSQHRLQGSRLSYRHHHQHSPHHRDLHNVPPLGHAANSGRIGALKLTRQEIMIFREMQYVNRVAAVGERLIPLYDSRFDAHCPRATVAASNDSVAHARIRGQANVGAIHIAARCREESQHKGQALRRQEGSVDSSTLPNKSRAQRRLNAIRYTYGAKRERSASTTPSREGRRHQMSFGNDKHDRSKMATKRLVPHGEWKYREHEAMGTMADLSRLGDDYIPRRHKKYGTKGRTAGSSNTNGPNSWTSGNPARHAKHWQGAGVQQPARECSTVNLDDLSEPSFEEMEIRCDSSSTMSSANQPSTEGRHGRVDLLGRKYEPIQLLGEGAYGRVLKCRNRSFNRSDPHGQEFVAVKELKMCPDDEDIEQVRRIAEREVELLKSLQHENIVRYLDDFRANGQIYVVMELAAHNLLEILDRHPDGMPRAHAHFLTLQLTRALKYIHSRGVIYRRVDALNCNRDIKPENVLVDDNLNVKLCDFGFARELHLNTPVAALTGYVATRWYRAPELLLGPPYETEGENSGKRWRYTTAIDIWALGCLLAEVVEGRPLIPGDSDLDQLDKIQQLLGPLPGALVDAFLANYPASTTEITLSRRKSQSDSASSDRRGSAAEIASLRNHLSEKWDNRHQIDFLAGTLRLDPQQRFSADLCLSHPYLSHS